MKIKYLITLLILTFLFNCNKLFSQETGYRLSKSVSGSGGILFSNSNTYFLLATAGETFTGVMQTQDYSLRSGFWSKSPFNLTDAIEIDEVKLPDKFNLYQNFPNPFNPTTIIKYDLVKPSIVKIEVFNILGQKVSAIVNSELKEAGSHQVIWEGKDSKGGLLSSGIYIYRIEARSENNTTSQVDRAIKKMIFLK
jgi:hypothetical protein